MEERVVPGEWRASGHGGGEASKRRNASSREQKRWLNRVAIEHPCLAHPPHENPRQAPKVCKPAWPLTRNRSTAGLSTLVDSRAEHTQEAA